MNMPALKKQVAGYLDTLVAGHKFNNAKRDKQRLKIIHALDKIDDENKRDFLHLLNCYTMSKGLPKQVVDSWYLPITNACRIVKEVELYTALEDIDLEPSNKRALTAGVTALYLQAISDDPNKLQEFAFNAVTAAAIAARLDTRLDAQVAIMNKAPKQAYKGNLAIDIAKAIRPYIDEAMDLYEDQGDVSMLSVALGLLKREVDIKIDDLGILELADVFITHQISELTGVPEYAPTSNEALQKSVITYVDVNGSPGQIQLSVLKKALSQIS